VAITVSAGGRHALDLADVDVLGSGLPWASTEAARARFLDVDLAERGQQRGRSSTFAATP